MLKSFKVFTLILISIFFFGTAPVQADSGTANKAEIEKIIKNYIMENPLVIMQSVEQYQREQSSAQQGQALTKHYRTLFKNDNDPVMGNPNGDVTIIEFFDYNCGYCKRAFSGVQALLKEDTNIRFIFKEFPILGPSSELAAKWALAAQKQGKYTPFHIALMEGRGKIDEAKLVKIAESMGLDINRMKQDANSAEIKDTIQKNRDVARALNINGTPGFIIGDQVIPGAVSVDKMKELVKAKRAKK
jgi:protein-disulfide isomerase